MSYVIASYVAVFGCVGVYAARLFIRARAAAQQVLSVEQAAVEASETKTQHSVEP
jgi:hypothetical protein